MAIPVHFGPQPLGTTVTYTVDVTSAAGEDVAFAGDETLAFEVVPLAGGAAVAAPAIAWDDAASGLVAVEVDADPDTYLSGVYRVAGSVEVDGAARPFLGADSFIVFTPAAGSASTFAPGRPARSSASPYCTPEEFLRHVDRDFAGQLVRDDGGIDTADELAFDAVLEEALLAASGEVESAATRGERYTPADLAALAASGTSGAALLRAVVASLAAVRLRLRRAQAGEPIPQEPWAYDMLDRLSRGDRVFPILAAQQAGRPEQRFVTPAERASVAYVSDDARFWGTRARATRPRF